MRPGPALLIVLTLALASCSDSGDETSEDAGTGDADAAADGTDAGGAAGTVPADFVVGGASCTSGSSAPAGTIDGNGETIVVDAPAAGADTDAQNAVDASDDVDTTDGPGPCAVSPTALDPDAARPATGTGTLAFDGRAASLVGALLSVESEGAADVPDELYLVLHDGETRIERSESVDGNATQRGSAWGVYGASAALTVGLHPGAAGEGPAGRIYDATADARDLAGPGTEGVGLAAEPVLLMDLDGDGRIGFDELVEPVAGQIVWSGDDERPSFTFTFTLEDGRAIEGSYEGGYERID